MNENTNSSEIKDDIVKRLENLNKWQEEQKQLLQERQNLQRQMLGMEQRKMYEMLGMLPDDAVSEAKTIIGNNPSSNSDVCRNNFSKQAIGNTPEVINSIRSTENIELIKNPELKPKRSFLRRGEGLKQRFKIDPDALRLNNLPRYKFANVHSRFSNSRSQSSRKGSKSEKLAVINDELLDIQERRFQQLLISSNNLCNSTPDTKFVNQGSNTMCDSVPKVHFEEKKEESKQALKTVLSKGSYLEQSGSWAKVLDNQQIKPISIHQLRPVEYASDVEEPCENLSIFELLEQKANEGSIDMNSSTIQRIMEKRVRNQDDQDEIPVQSHLHTAGFLPKVAEVESVILSDTDDGEEGTNKEDSDYDSTLTPQKQKDKTKPTVQVRFAEVHDTHEYTDESETSSAVANESSSFEIFQQFKQALFSALNTKDMDNYINATAKNSDRSETTMLQQSTIPSSKTLVSEDLQAVINLVRARLAELEQEISTFKENNIRLIKAKQEFELEKALFSQERLEAMDKLKDEKIQLEIYLHDEKMKIENEKRTFERQMQMQKTTISSRDRKEITKLKQDLDEMQSQLKQREQTHIAAQARLRAQIRNLEKDQKQLYDEIDRLTKENKHLQNDNVRISRENNNKMLQEINRNIAKLAPKLVHLNSEEETAFRFKETTVSGGKAPKNKQQSCKRKEKLHLVKNSSGDHRQSDGSLSSDCEVYTNEDKISNHKNSDGDREAKSKQLQTLNLPADTNDSTASLNTNEFKREIINPDGSKDIWYPNGNLKKISPDGMFVRMLYFNKDIKETNINEGTVKYYYAETNTWHTSYLDGLEILEFPNGQTEHRYKNGIIEVHFPNDSIKVTNPADEHIKEEWRFADGTILKEMRSGDKILTLPNGQKEIHTKLNKRREYPDGTVKIVYPDGSQETRYSNGRVRLKDKDGQLIMDSENAK